MTAAGTSFSCHHDGTTTPVALPLLGIDSAVPAALAALAVGAHLGVAVDDAVAALGRAAPVPGRLRPLPGRGAASCSTTPTTRLPDR